ncbi:hypothetical protein ACFL3F_05710 [Planctomycetota bacterium]
MSVFAGTLVWAESKKQVGWFDAETCEYCKLMSTNPEMMSAMKFETHKINDGMLIVVMVPEPHQKTFETLWSKMHEMDKQIATSGESVSMCGCCESFEKLKQAGAKDQEITTAFGKILLVKAKDPATVKMIHKHVDRTLKEEKKMAEAMKIAEGKN